MAFGDVDSDGDLDIYIGNRRGAAHTSETPDPQPNELYLNHGDGTFVADMAFFEDEELNPPSLTRAAAFGDANNDGALDLFVANSGANLLLVNRGGGDFEAADDALPPADESTWGVAFADVDNDGDYDLVLGNTAFNPFAQVILINSGGAQDGRLGQFEVGEFPIPAEGQSAIRLGLEVTDLNADGLPEVIFPVHELGTGERPDLYLNDGGEFVLDPEFEATRGVYSTLAAGDLDGDGDVDLFVPKSGIFGAGDRLQFYAMINQTFAADDAPMAWLRGDANGDLTHDTADALFILGFLLLGGDEPECASAGDVDGNEVVEITDAVALLSHLFLGEALPRAPYPDLGDAEGPLALGCDRVSIFLEE